MSLFKRWFFVILLLVGAIAGGLGFLAQYLDYRALHVNGAPALLEQHSRAAPPGPPVYVGEKMQRRFQVAFTAQDGERVVRERYIPTDIADRLLRGEKVEIVYDPGHRARFIFNGEQLPTGWKWGISGLALLALFVIALRFMLRGR